jgi:adenylate cyclase class 2
MAASTETEIKFRVQSLQAIEEKLRELGFRMVHERAREMNVLYDFPSRELTKRGELLRLRQYGHNWKLTHKAKGHVGKHKSRMETETSVAEGAALEAIFSSLGLTPTFRYEKFRAEWSDGHGHVVVDETPIGNFAEIEGPGKWIDATAKKLDVKEGDYITLNYAGLFMQWKQETRSNVDEMTFAAIQPGKQNSR